MEVKINAQTAEIIYINHKTASYGIFCFNSIGDLFVNSDWGFYGYAWRAYGENFKMFLSRCDSDYIIRKFEINYSELTNKSIPKHRKENIKILLDVFIEELKKNLNN